MKRLNKSLILALCTLPLALCTSCKDYLTEIEPGTTLLEDFYTSTAACQQNVTGCYTPLMWEYGGTYFSEWFIGDIASDDALKGGGTTSDMADAYDFENWRTTSQNSLLKAFYRAQYQGIGRCNLALKYIGKTPLGIDAEFTQEMKDRLLGEVYYLRAYYYFRLVRVFAGVPLTLEVLDSSDKWGIGRASVNDVYNQILADLDSAEVRLWEKSQYLEEDMGRATKGAAQAMLMKVNLYMASPYWQRMGVTKTPEACYADVEKYGQKIMDANEYDLCPNYEDNFFVAGENGLESVFEIQYAEVAWGDYGEGMGFTAGSFTQILTRSRSSLIGGGWGFNHPTQNLYDEFEEGDVRRDVAILVPADDKMENIAEEVYLGNKYVNNKYGMYRDPENIGGGFGKWSLHASRGPLNNKQIRYADVLLMLAEARIESGKAADALPLLNKVRERAGLADLTTADRKALRHERRCELAMEGHRWFDLVRWEGVEGNGLKAHMDAYKLTETKDAQSHMNEFIKDKHEIFPIPHEEIQLNPTAMEQNPGY